MRDFVCATSKLCVTTNFCATSYHAINVKISYLQMSMNAHQTLVKTAPRVLMRSMATDVNVLLDGKELTVRQVILIKIVCFNVTLGT